MDNIFDLSGKALHPSRVSLRNYVTQAKTLSAFEGVVWDAMIWELGNSDPTVQKRAYKHRSRRLHFTDLASVAVSKKEKKTSLRQPFQDFLKAFVRRRAAARNQVVNDQQRVISAGRYLENALVQSTGEADPAKLTLRIFHIAEEMIAGDLQKSTAYRTAGKLEQISNALDQHGLASSRIGYQNTLKRPPNSDGLDEESQRRGMAMLPTEATLQALAEISNAPADAEEKILMRHVDLLVTCGFRIGEALTLPVHCWVEEKQNGSPLRFGIRYWPEKGGEPIVKWLPTAAVELAKRAVDDLKILCAPARMIALWLEENPRRLSVFSEHHPDNLLGREELGRILGYTSGEMIGRLCLHVGNHPGKSALYRVGDVEAALCKRRFDEPLLIRPDGRKQLLSQSLSVAFENQFHKQRTTLRFLVRPIRLQQIQDALGVADRCTVRVRSVFDLRNLLEGGKPMRVRTHAFRHWLNTLADRGGLGDAELARWMGRRDVKQNATYKHGTVAHRTQKAREMIAQGSLIGPVSEVYHSLPPIEREEFLNAAVEAVHFTEIGACVHNYAASPCERHLSCLRGCPDYLRTKGDPDERAALLRLKESTDRARAMALEALATEEYGASNYVQHNEDLLRGIDRALAVDDLPSAPGSPTTVFPDGKRPN